MGQAIEALAHFVAGTAWEAIPEAVRAHAKLVLLDTLGVILAGSVQPEVAGVRARSRPGRGCAVSRARRRAWRSASARPSSSRPAIPTPSRARPSSTWPEG